MSASFKIVYLSEPVILVLCCVLGPKHQPIHEFLHRGAVVVVLIVVVVVVVVG